MHRPRGHIGPHERCDLARPTLDRGAAAPHQHEAQSDPPGAHGQADLAPNARIYSNSAALRALCRIRIATANFGFRFRGHRETAQDALSIDLGISGGKVIALGAGARYRPSQPPQRRDSRPEAPLPFLFGPPPASLTGTHPPYTAIFQSQVSTNFTKKICVLSFGREQRT